MSLDFTGKTVAVTGAATGFGRAIAHRFARHGSRVFATDVDSAGLAETASMPGISQHVLDLTDRPAVAAWIAQFKSHETFVQVDRPH